MIERPRSKEWIGASRGHVLAEVGNRMLGIDDGRFSFRFSPGPQQHSDACRSFGQMANPYQQFWDFGSTFGTGSDMDQMRQLQQMQMQMLLPMLMQLQQQLLLGMLAELIQNMMGPNANAMGGVNAGQQRGAFPSGGWNDQRRMGPGSWGGRSAPGMTPNTGGVHGPPSSQGVPAGLRPNAARGAQVVRDMGFNGTIGGIGHRSGASDHPHGNAIDVMTNSNRAQGRQIAEHFRANHEQLGVKYVIFEQHIASARNNWQWRPMADRGSPTANHMDHPHISFY